MNATSLQAVAINERARLLRFLAARGAGDEAEDLFQELWQRVARPPAQPITDPLSYLFRAADNLMCDLRRSRQSSARRQFDWHEAISAASEDALCERALIARQRLDAVEKVLGDLGPRVSIAFRRYRLEEQSQAAIARELGVSLSSVEKDLQKAYRALAELKRRFDAE
ncbi:sigma-70 family RNA polymerase sigma factor [Altererythrobacter fulvus]|uniref:sigma-70 family RNA polymerase sigma factor n=1 Tax=Caenibius fulvus TaxID=2126012 RepID=UPI00301A63DC